jgi:chromosomal replication initiation ATPase DnaA
MTRRSQQLTLDLPHRPALGREDFLVTASNAAAVALIDQWPAWPSPAAALMGPEGCGKTHLMEVWRTASGARVIAASTLSVEDAPALIASGAGGLEDVAPGAFDQRALFHLLNLVRQTKASLLITSQFHPEQWQVTLPDLASRLRTVPVVDILPPDDDLLRGVLVKLFIDRQVPPDEVTISYLLTRMPRALGAARAIVAAVDRVALAEKAEITRPLVARVLAAMHLDTTAHDGGDGAS